MTLIELSYLNHVKEKFPPRSYYMFPPLYLQNTLFMVNIIFLWFAHLQRIMGAQTRQ